MLEYTYDEALEVLQTSLNNATEKMVSPNEEREKQRGGVGAQQTCVTVRGA